MQEKHRPAWLDRAFLTVKEVANVLGISRSKAYELVGSGEIPAVVLPGTLRKRVRTQTLWEWVQRQAPEDE